MVWTKAIVPRPCPCHQQALHHLLCKTGLRAQCLPHGCGSPAERKHAVRGVAPDTISWPVLAPGVLSCPQGGQGPYSSDQGKASSRPLTASSGSKRVIWKRVRHRMSRRDSLLTHIRLSWMLCMICGTWRRHEGEGWSTGTVPAAPRAVGGWRRQVRASRRALLVAKLCVWQRGPLSVV